MDLKHLPSIVDDDNSESKSESKSEPELKPESKSYEELPKEIHHPSHPNHPLYLFKRENFDLHTCNVCSKYITAMGYHCENSECDFKLHLECASVMPSIKHEEHNHLLTLTEVCEKNRECQNCHCVTYSTYARCIPCDINYHLQCGRQRLPDTTIYEFHNHPLFLIYNNDEDKFCDACDKEIHPNIDETLYKATEWPMYNCQECDSSYHVRCMIFEIKLDKREKLDHTCHEHVLFLCDENEKDEDSSCSVCGNVVCVDDETAFTYGCSPCSFYIHRSCIDKFPVREIAHEFHPDHPLILYWKKVGFECNACCMKINGFTYRCVECDFDVGLDCTLKHPSIRDKDHPHLLTYFDKTYQNQECVEECGFNCVEECGFNSPDAGFLRCVQCNLSVHLLCSALPREIKFKGHWHSLALEDYLIEDDFGEYYCDECEDLRDPKECVYHCAEGCPYVVEFNCVVDEVFRSLNDGVVGVRKVNRHAVDEYHFRMVTKGLYLHDVYQSSEEEELELKGLKMSTQMELETMMEKGYLHASFSLFNSDAIERARKKWLDSPLLPVDLKCEVVKIGNYIITKDLETVFSKIHCKYSDIGDKCSLSEGSKTIVLIQFVQVIHEMTETMIVNISKEVFLSWLFRLLFARQAGYALDFVFKHTNKVGAACFGVKKELDTFPELKGYFKGIKGLTENIDFQKAKLVSIRTQEKERVNFQFEGSSKDARLQLLSNMDFVLEKADKGLL